MPILVVGATGYIGSNVTRHLSAGGYDVVALARSDASAQRLREPKHRGQSLSINELRDTGHRAAPNDS